jgi:hypothetical protein
MFKRSWTVLTVALAAAVLGTSACEMQRGATDLLQPSRIEGSRGAAPALEKLHSARHSRPVAVKRIGPNGGVLEVGRNRLTVPAGAVREPVVFRMQLEDGAVQVDLAATRPTSRRQNDVGSVGFDRPLHLELSYEEAPPAGDPSELVVVWVRDDGTLVPLPSTVDRGARSVTASLNHFSGYALAMPSRR